VRSEHHGARLQAAACLRAALSQGSDGTSTEPKRDEAASERLFARLSLQLRGLGITRLGDLTGLDTIGIPVWFACRPNSRSLSVYQGKALTHRAARLGAVMEAAEDAVAERAERAVTCRGSLREMERHRMPVVPLDSISRCMVENLDLDRERSWVPGLSLLTGATVYAPYELIGMDLRSGTAWDHHAFQMSSIGLAAGSTLYDATRHALLEAIEHEVTAELDVFGFHVAGGKRLRLASGLAAHYDALADRLATVEATPTLVDLGRHGPVSVVGAFLPRPILDANGTYGSTYCAGFAARPDIFDAAFSALLEAVQSRLTDIAGARDDLLPKVYRAARSPVPALPEIAVADRTSPPANDLAAVCAAATACGAEDILLFPFDCADLGISVARVIVTRLQAASTDGVTLIGMRTLRRLMAGTADLS